MDFILSILAGIITRLMSEKLIRVLDKSKESKK